MTTYSIVCPRNHKRVVDYLLDNDRIVTINREFLGNSAIINTRSVGKYIEKDSR